MSGPANSTIGIGPVDYSLSDVVYNDVTNLMQVALMAVCLYDHCLTLPREVAFIWQRKMSISSWMFLANRYAILCNSIIGVVELVGWNPHKDHMANQTCNITGRVMDVCTVMVHVVYALFAAIRTYAIWGKDLRVFFCILVPGLIYPAGCIYHSVQGIYVASFPSPLTGCDIYDTLPEYLTPAIGADNLFFILAAGSTLLFEGATIALTLMKTVPAVRHLRLVDRENTLPVSYVIFYDGTIQFITILILNCICLLQLAWAPLGYLFNLSDVLTSIIISRFILDLREDYIARSQDSGGGSYHASDMSTVRFGSVVRATGSSDSKDSSATQTLQREDREVQTTADSLDSC